MPRLGLRGDDFCCRADDGQRVFDLACVALSGAGQDGAAGAALEQRHAEEFLELLDLVADGGRRHAELRRALGEAAVPAGGLEGLQGL